MKKIVLIGDSIRMGYDKYIKDSLAGKAEVFYPTENCKFAEYILRFAHGWKNNGGWGKYPRIKICTEQSRFYKQA